jgi:Matrixin
MKAIVWTRIVLMFAAGLALSTATNAYVITGPTWASGVVPYVLNPTNLDLTLAPAEAAVRDGADTWYLQSGAAFRFSYSGRSAQTTTTYDGVNLVVFRSASNGPAIATTYWWSSGGHIVDADIVFWDGAFRFFAGTTGCSGGFYIEDIAAHEFGHALGLGHSASTAATMYFSTSSGNTGNRILDTDDIAGARSLYPQPLPSGPTGFRVTG